IYLSPSTQERNIGVGKYGTEEERMNQLADIVQPLLQYNGFTVYRNKPSMTLEQVVQDSNSKIGSNDIHLALHTNAGGGEGTEIFYYTGSKDGERLSKTIYDEVAPITPSRDRGVKHNKVFRELNGTKGIATLLEVIFHDNKADADFMINNMEKVAIAVVKGVCKYTGKSFRSMLKNETVKSVGSETFYQVVTGSFKDKQNAEKRMKELKVKGFDSFIQVKY